MRDKQREETRRRLYLAALEVFRRDGVQGCRIDDIAQKAEVSRAAFYFHFPTKEHVLLDFLKETEAPTARAIAELDAGADLDTLLDTTVEAMASVWQKEPGLLIDAMTVSLRHTAIINDREAGPVRHVMAARFQDLAARGQLAPGLPAEVLSDFFLSNCFVTLMTWAGAPQNPLEPMLKGSVQLFLKGARPHPAAKRS